MERSCQQCLLRGIRPSDRLLVSCISRRRFIGKQKVKRQTSPVSISKAEELTVSHKFTKTRSEGQYSVELTYFCKSLFTRPTVVTIYWSFPSCERLTISFKKVCRLLSGSPPKLPKAPKHSLQTVLEESNKHAWLTVDGRLTFRLPGLSEEESNSPKYGVPIMTDVVSLKLASLVPQVCLGFNSGRS